MRVEGLKKGVSDLRGWSFLVEGILKETALVVGILDEMKRMGEGRGVEMGVLCKGGDLKMAGDGAFGVLDLGEADAEVAEEI